MSKRTLGVLALTVGVLAFVGSLAADRLGMGTSPGLGWLQILGILGAVVVAVWGMRQLRHD